MIPNLNNTIPEPDFLKFLEHCSGNETFCTDFGMDYVCKNGYLKNSDGDSIKITRFLQTGENPELLRDLFMGFLSANSKHFNHGQVNNEIKCLSKIVHKVDEGLGTTIANQVEDKIILLINIKKEKLIPLFPCYYLRSLGFDNLEHDSHLPLAQRLIELGKYSEVIDKIKNINIEKEEDRITIAKQLLFEREGSTELMDKITKAFGISESQLLDTIHIQTTSDDDDDPDNNALESMERFMEVLELSEKILSDTRNTQTTSNDQEIGESFVGAFELDENQSSDESEEDSINHTTMTENVGFNRLGENYILEEDLDCFSTKNETSTRDEPLEEGIKLKTRTFSNINIIRSLKLALIQWLKNQDNKEVFKASLQKALNDYQPYLSNSIFGYLNPSCWTRTRTPIIKNFIKEVNNSNSMVDIFCEITRDGGWKDNSYNTLFLKDLVLKIIETQKKNDLDSSVKAQIISTIEINKIQDNMLKDIAKRVQDYNLNS